MKQQWNQFSDDFYLRDISTNLEKLPPFIYELEVNQKTNEFYLSKLLDKFTFNYKIYGIETDFINRINKTYLNTKNNLGILLNGIRGTGKTVTSKLICNKLNLPVIIINNNWEDIPSFINSIKEDIIIFFDEFEKVYNEKDHSLLPLMDGVRDNGFRRVFLFTANNLTINENLLYRPGRIRYFKCYEDLPLSIIKEIIDDKLIHIELKDKLIKFLSKVHTISIDILKSIIEEMNIHKESPESFVDIFNVRMKDPKYNVFKLNSTTNEFERFKCNISHVEPKNDEAFNDEDVIKFDEEIIGEVFRADHMWLGNIVKVIDVNTIKTSYIDEDLDNKEVFNTYRVEYIEQLHTNFLSI